MKLSSQTFTTAIVLLGRAVAQTPSGFSPATDSTLGVKFGVTAVGAGDGVPLGKTAASPALSFPDVSRNSSHVVVMVDIDAPGGPANNSFSPFLHWLTPVGSGLKSLPNNQSASDAFASYVGPAPPVGSGPHRYIVLLFTDSATTFHMPASFKDLDPSNLNDRAVFDVEKFADEGGFQLAAASWFTTENSTDVPEVPVAAAPRMAGDVGVGLLGLASFCGLAWGLF